MLISLPFLRAGVQEDDPTQPVTTLGERSGKGAFPVSREFSWHGSIGAADLNVAAITTPVNGGSTGLPERKEFFHYVNFILGDAPNMPTDSTLTRQVEE